MTSVDSHEAMEASERRQRAAVHHEVQHGEFGAGHVSYVPPELLCVLVAPREGSVFHRVLPSEGVGGYGSAPLHPEQLAVARVLCPWIDAMAAARGEVEIV